MVTRISGRQPNPNLKLEPVVNKRVSDELYALSIGKLNANPAAFSAGYKNRVIHLIDSVSRGYTTPLEAYDALRQKYFPSHLETRKSAYMHLIY